ncbi:ArsC family reductase [Noviherbaspirillum galbum]|uniref:ArsC family reductase n=1 Tax=Noviherbaspirillum galbum TaxID=2709383 RepID=A0A6B3SFW6_9BURK|nr:ArsC family reductase [Noviherbaspirillum galbum]NEX59787.1 ArsC family reductase [Noviherbaspirillum galbum]
MTTITLYGIPNCDTVKKARAWLDSQGIAYVFHDFKKAGLQRELVDAWLRDVAWDVLVNRKGTTWRGLDDARKAAVTDAAAAAELVLANPSVVKRPVLAVPGNKTHVGFSPDLYQQIFDR